MEKPMTDRTQTLATPTAATAIDDQNARHDEKMKKIKAARDRMMAEKIDKKGLVIVHTGKGKGKSSSAFGMAMRCVGHGMKVGVVQFIKGGWETGEAKLLAQFPELCEFHAMGAGFTWETQNRAQDIALARQAWEKAREMMRDPSYAMVILDELNIVLRYDFVPLDDVLAALVDKLPDQHVVITGRNAPEKLIEAADLVTEMTMVKHPFREQGIKAQIGVEF
jgi:cob(I)alamin adenosyltransferase